MKTVWMIAVTVTLLIVGFIFIATPSKDDSDPEDGRSGMSIYTDNLTGCQYLSKPGLGGLSPRMSADGNQICVRKQ